MFSGLVEQTSPVLHLKQKGFLIQMLLKRPKKFTQLKEGESISVDGVCLTLESFDKQKMFFTLGPETLKITNWDIKKITNRAFNLERSLSLQSAIGGHLLTGHVDDLARVKKIKKQGESLIVQVEIPNSFKNFFWKKAYIALNGVSLTINEVKNKLVEICLIPKTLELTNLSKIKQGELLNFEVDYMSRFFVHGFETVFKKLKKELKK